MTSFEERGRNPEEDELDELDESDIEDDLELE